MYSFPAGSTNINIKGGKPNYCPIISQKAWIGQETAMIAFLIPENKQIVLRRQKDTEFWLPCYSRCLVRIQCCQLEDQVRYTFFRFEVFLTLCSWYARPELDKETLMPCTFKLVLKGIFTFESKRIILIWIPLHNLNPACVVSLMFITFLQTVCECI